MNANVSEMNLSSDQNIGRLVFGWLDYCMFTGLLGLSLLVGVYFGFFSKQNSASEYLYGGKSMHYFPVAVSILASFLSGITFLGVPTEVYQYGSQYYVTIISCCIIALGSSYVTMPVFHRMQISSCFEYLELRFSKRIRTFSSVLYIISLLLFIPVVVYVPAIAFSQVTGFGVHGVTPVLCLICITYTSMGGVKAVVWTDTIQFIFTIGGMIAVLTLGVLSVGSISTMWKIADQGGRIKIFDFEPNMTNGHTFWALAIGFTFAIYSRLGLGQKFIQRYLAIKKESDMKKAIFITSVGWGLIQLCCVFTGILMYAKYHDCDPRSAKMIKRPDQILPFYVMDVAGQVSGLPGIFLAGLASSALSTMSASMNTLSGVIYDTFIDSRIQESPRKDALAARIMKVISVTVGLITICLIFVIERLGTIFEMAIGLGSVAEGTLLGLFLAGMLLPWIGKKGAMAGALVSFFIMAWIVGGSQYYTMQGKIRSRPLPMSIEGCPASVNQTWTNQSASVINNQALQYEDEPLVLYRISVLYFTFIGSLIVVIVGGVVSFMVGETDLSKVDPDHVSPVVRRFVPEKRSYKEVPVYEVEMTTSLNKKT